ncbi:MAG: hypothetical protein B7C24_15765 [Bacteroidetes bacterium 4572_77]|nr:MAG: hypothetical protein B7C24_15765 [Bacteroidetes bacterium 4572_77]
MTKKENNIIAQKAGYSTSIKMNAQTLEFCANIAKRKMRPWLKVREWNEDVQPTGKWATAKDYFPEIDVGQESRVVHITTFNSTGFQKRATVETEWIDIAISNAHDALYIRGSVYVKNWVNYKCSGSQNFCFAVFVGDSDHVYTHRAPATKGWMDGDPNSIRKRLRKLGIGATKGVYQQGDFLLKPANRSGFPDSDFAHERMGSGHHNFEVPVLYHRGQFFITEPTTLIHTAVDGIQHPDIIVSPGKYIVGTTANQLTHGNARD